MDKKEVSIKKVESVDELFERLDKEEKAHPIKWWCSRKFYQLKRLPGEIKLKIKTFIQRGKRGYADSDVWGFFSYLTDVMLGGLKQLRKSKYGYLATLNPKTGEYDYDEKRWNEILDKMIYTFEIAKKIEDNYPNKEYFYIPTDEWDKKKDIRDNLSNGYRVMTKKECLAYEEGWKLFEKYFFSLWD